MRRFYVLMCMMFAATLTFAQDVELRGTVNDAEGNALGGAAVVIKGTPNGVFTGADGSFVLRTQTESGTLVITFLGMKTMEQEYSGSEKFTLNMEVDELLLDEVVVTALGIKQSKKALGYSVQSIGGDEISRTGETNLMNSLSGKIAGLQVISSSGTPGGSSFMKIRGASSLTGNNQPLIIVDGVPIDNSQNLSGNPDDGNNNLLGSVALSNRGIDLNSSDIEDISVLKGPAAAALYGINAANGAIVITTKKGKATGGKGVNVSFNTSLQFDQVNRLPKLQDQYAQGTGWFDFDSLGNPIQTYYGPETGWLTSWGPSVDTLHWDGDTDYDYDDNGRIVGQSDPSAGAQVSPYDNLGTFFKTGVTTNHNLALAGGGQFATYRFSVGQTKQTGIVPNSDFTRTTAKMAGESQLSDKVKVASSITYVKSGGRRTQQGSNTSGLMLGLLRTPITFDNANGSDDPVNDPGTYILEDGSQRNFRGGGGYDNPYWTVNQTPFDDAVNRMYGFASVSYDPVDWVNVFYRAGTDFYSDRRRQTFAINSRTLPAGQVFEDQHFFRNFNSDLWITLKRKFSEDLSGSLILGQNMYMEDYQRLYTQGDGFNFPNFTHISNAASVLTRETTTRKRTAAVFANARLNYKDYLFLDLSARNEWSSTLPEDNRSFLYPAVSAGFVFTDAFGISDNNILPYGKLRASFASVGNDAGVYETQTFYTSSAIGDGWTNGISFPIAGVSGFQTSTILGNPVLRPEKTTSFEIGTDLRFAKNRLGLDITYYSSKSTDQIFAVAIAASSGFRRAIMNAGEVTNKGLELILTATPVKSDDFRWDIMLNFQKNTNMVNELAPGVENLFLGGFEGSAIRAVAGSPYGAIYGGQFLRDANGSMVIEDDTNAFFYGYPIADVSEGMTGNPNPDFIMGLRNSFTYKGLRFSFLIDWKQGGDMWNGTQGALTFFGMSELTEDRGATKVFEGVKGTLDADGNIVSSGTTNDITVALNEDWYTDNGGGFGSVMESFVQDASFIKLRELSLDYNFSSIIKSGFLKNLELGFSARNFLLWTPYEGIDPETNLMGSMNAQGLDYFNMPGTKSYSFRLKVNL